MNEGSNQNKKWQKKTKRKTNELGVFFPCMNVFEIGDRKCQIILIVDRGCKQAF